METLYERYVAKKISMALNGLFDVVIQDETQSIFDEVRKICLRPDIVLYGPDKSPVILDTKWKALSSVSDISTSDLYQMIVYTAKYRSKEAFLLYPKNSLNETLVMHESFFEHDVSITAFFVDLNDIEGSLESLIHIIQHDC